MRNSAFRGSQEEKTPAPPDIIIQRDIGIPMDDGIVLRADVFRPKDDGKFPVIMNQGPYGKGLRYQEGYSKMWNWLIERHPEILDRSTGSYLTWETVDPERWVASGYAVVRVDCRGAGRSPGILDPYSPREICDFYIAIEWAGVQPWSNGKVGLCGISYYAITQWLVASLQPPHLAAIIPWEGAADHYRDRTHHGGILSNVFPDAWYKNQILPIQHGKGANGPRDPWLDEPAAGPETLTEKELEANRADYLGDIKRHNLDDDHHRSRSPDFSKINVPLLSAANWGGFGLHQRGNFEGFTRSASVEKWLEVHVGRHEEYFYAPPAVELQMRFFDHFLKGEDNGWDREPRVLMTVRHVNRFELRKENEWPLSRTIWTKSYLDARNLSLSMRGPVPLGKAQFRAMSDGVTFMSPPLEAETEIIGPLASKLYVASSTTDADLFLTFRAFDTEGKEVDFQGTLDPHTPLSQGWLRASHRKIDPVLSTPFRPYHPHDELQPLESGSVYELDVELWPTCIVLPAGFRMALTVSGEDFQRPSGEGEFRGITLKGSGPFLHTDADDRPAKVFGGMTEIHTGSGKDSFLLIPIIPTSSTGPS